MTNATDNQRRSGRIDRVTDTRDNTATIWDPNEPGAWLRYDLAAEVEVKR